ncbi:MAG: hypothetical protein M3388_14805 [Acidobacteriota bacterium]|nr:hypothetical protein [Acidobacteriota bacterium]
MKFYLSAILILVFAFSVFGQTSVGSFEKIKMSDIGTVLIPSTMELQSGTYKNFSDTVSKDLMKKQGIEITGDNIIFQPKGLNDFKKLNTYARVIINTTIGKKGEYRKITAKLVATKREINEVSAIFKKQFEDEFKNTGLKIVRWDGVSVESVNGRSVMRVAYLRQLKDNPSVYVEMYYFENYDRMHLLTISYREEDASIWKEDLETTKNSFTITNIR